MAIALVGTTSMETSIHDTYVSVFGIQVWPPSWALLGAIAAIVTISAVAVAALAVGLSVARSSKHHE
jgi:hypothetical protein